VLFLDEPTNSLDPAHQIELIRIMRRFAQTGNTLLVVCHDLNLPIALGGRVLAIREGTVFFDQPVDLLQDTDRLARLFDARFVLHHDAAGETTSIQLGL